MASSNEDPSWVRQLVVGLSALVVISLLVGGVVGGVVLGATRLSGLGERSITATAEPSLYLPTGRPTTSPQSLPDPPQRSRSASPSAEATPTKKKKPARRITLRVTPAQAAAGQRIDLIGTYRNGDGATLQVQRFESGWTDFPVDTQVSDGAYRTYIYTNRTGPTRFRMLDKASGRASAPVRIRIG